MGGKQSGYLRNHGLELAGLCEYGNEHSCFMKCGEFLASWETVSFSRRTLLHGVRYNIIN